jgi:phage terminase large subunit-like protein
MPEVIERRIKLHPAQAAFRRSEALYRGFVGGRGAGKTWIGAYDLIRRAKRGRTYLIASPTGLMLSDLTLPALESIARDLCVWGGCKLSPYPTAFLSTGATIRLRTAEDPERLRGPNLSGIWLDEASLMHADAYRVCIASLREGGEQGWLSATFTPKGFQHWTYQVFGQRKPKTEIFHARTADNPFLPPEFQSTLEGQYDQALIAQELEGRFIDVANTEWPSAYFGAAMWFEDWPKNLRCRAWILDPSKGRTDKADYSAYVALGIDLAGDYWCEADLQRRSPEQIVEDGLEHFLRWPADGFGVEANAMQELFGSIFKSRAATRNILLPLYLVDNYAVAKQVRIRRLGPLLRQGKLHFRRTAGTKLLVEQLQEFPFAPHDDGPDALEMGCRLIGHLLRQPGQQPAREVIRLG